MSCSSNLNKELGSCSSTLVSSTKSLETSGLADFPALRLVARAAAGFATGRAGFVWLGLGDLTGALVFVAGFAALAGAKAGAAVGFIAKLVGVVSAGSSSPLSAG